ncbi:hypothetical protein BRC82_06245 [Halobacteriales archaeon QS_1_67_19]|nr:MAG: hypothetical protein BRC82_06245 [Halobacteriales archaeon QS_1_67_19]
MTTTDETQVLSVLDRALYALFSRHADSNRHDIDRKRYRATDVTAVPAFRSWAGGFTYSVTAIMTSSTNCPSMR